jgi:hypothetical protein
MAVSILAIEPNRAISAPDLSVNANNRQILPNNYKHQSSKGLINTITNDPGEVKIYWTAPGDDGNIGRASRYEIRFWGVNNGPIDNDWKWRRATIVGGAPIPSMAGNTDSLSVRGLDYGAQYYFCIRAYDEVENQSPLSASIIFEAGDNDTSAIVPGDANGNGEVRGNDVLYLVAYFRGDVPPPHPFLNGDSNGDCSVDPSDIMYLTRYFKGFGDPPTAGQCGLLRDYDISDNELSH